MGDNIRKSGFDILLDNVPAGATGWDMLKYAPALPANYRPQEISSYSPALKKTGGYSYKPLAAKEENPMAKPQESRKYKPNFLFPFEIPPETTEQQEEKWWDMKTEETKKPQDNKKFINGTWYYLNPRDGKYYDAKGNRLP